MDSRRLHGLLIAYYGVWWIRGESAGLPRFEWLPFLPSEELSCKNTFQTDSPGEQSQCALPPGLEPGRGCKRRFLP